MNHFVFQIEHNQTVASVIVVSQFTVEVNSLRAKRIQILQGMQGKIK